MLLLYTFCCDIGKHSKSDLIRVFNLLMASLHKNVNSYKLLCFTNFKNILSKYISEKYNIEYIYVGELEKIYYPKEGLDKFNLMIQQGFKKIYYKNGFSVYKIELS